MRVQKVPKGDATADYAVLTQTQHGAVTAIHASLLACADFAVGWCVVCCYLVMEPGPFVIYFGFIS
jgi:hypothetical protein